MKKTTKSGVTWIYPLNKKTNIKCECYHGFYTIIDAATYQNQVYVLLEHNTYGDEAPLLLVALPSTCLRWYIVEKMNCAQEKSFFIRERDILEESYDTIADALGDHYPEAEFDDFDNIEFWTDEEIDNMEDK